MAIAFDAFNEKGGGGSSSITMSHTCTGSDLTLVVVVISTNNNVTGVTYNGISLTAPQTAQSNGNIYLRTWYLINPSTGSNNVIASASGSNPAFRVYAASYTGTNQSAIDTSKNATTSGTAMSISTTTTADNCWIVAGMSNNAGTVSAGTNCTFRGSTANSTRLGDTNGPQTPAGAHSIAMNGPSGSWVGTTLALAPTGGGGGSDPVYNSSFFGAGV